MKELIFLVLGICLGAGLSWFEFKYIWLNQRKLEEKIKILSEAAKALALFEREALDPEIQNNKRVFKHEGQGISERRIELSAKTDVLIRTVLIKTNAMFSEDAYNCLDSALGTMLNKDPDGDLHNEFIKKRKKAIEKMSEEIKAEMSNWYSSLPSCFKSIKKWCHDKLKREV
jgi:hypothetical protein